MHNTISSVGSMRKIVSLARDFATRRVAFGISIQQHPLHLQTLARMEVETRGCCAFMLDLSRLLGKVCKCLNQANIGTLASLLGKVCKCLNQANLGTLARLLGKVCKCLNQANIGTLARLLGKVCK